MNKLPMHSIDISQDNVERIAALFPHCVKEVKNEDGALTRKIDFDALRQELSDVIVEGPQERYDLNWPGKRAAMLTANAPIAKTLRPCVEESVNFDSTKNIFIEGDNLDALKLLQKSYLGKVKMIYIDPPYNTGNDFIYEDDFAESTEDFLQRSNQKDIEGNRLVANTESNGRFHSDWLSMIYPRLKLARNLLRDDGVIVISVDENEHSNLVNLAGQIFGEHNFCGEIVWKNSSKNDQKYISIQHEYFVFFVKSKQNNSGEWMEKKNGLHEIYKAFESFKAKHKDNWQAIHCEALEWYKKFSESSPIHASKHYNWMDEKGIYFPDNISGPNDGQYVYDVIHPRTQLACKKPSTGWRYPKHVMLERIKNNLVHFGDDHTTVPNNKTYLADTESQNLTSIRTLDGRSASKRLKALFGEKIFTNPKDEFLLRDIFSAVGISGNDVVLDFFAGSGTTIHALFELNRAKSSSCTCILVQYDESLDRMLTRAKGTAKKALNNAINFLDSKKLPRTIAEISKERIRRAGTKIMEEMQAKETTPAQGTLPLSPEPCAPSHSLDVGFRVLKVDSSNMADVYYTPDTISQTLLPTMTQNIKADRTPHDLLFQVLIDWGLEPTLSIREERILEKCVFFVDENSLVACFDMGITDALAKKLAETQPLRVLFRDNGFASDSVKINVEQIFMQMSPHTEVKCL